MKTHIIYHIADADGHMSGLIALKAHENSSEIEMHGYDNGFNYEELMAKIEDDDLVIMLDISLPKELMFELSDRAGDFIWIDHHQTAIDEVADIGIKGVQEVGTAACRLAWEYFYPNEVCPMGIALLAQYDVWDKEGRYDWKEQVMPFQYYWKYRDTDPGQFGLNSEMAILLSDNNINLIPAMVIDGRNILNYEKRRSKVMAETYAHVETINTGERSYNALCINSNVRSSMALDSMFDERKHDFMCVYVDTGTEFRISFYHPNAEEYGLHLGKDVAKKFGGGGHAGAAGCNLLDLPWEI